MEFGTAVALANVYIVKAGQTVALTQPDFPYLTGATIKLERGGPSQVSVSLEAPYDEGLILMESGLFSPGNVIEVRLGYPDDGVWTPWYYGMMLEPQVVVSPDGVTATLSGEQTAMVMRTSATRKWAKTSAKEIVTGILASYGLKAYFGDESTSLWDMPMFFVEQGGVSDWEFMKTLLGDHGLSFFFGTDANGAATCFIRSKDVGPVRTYRMRGGFDTEKRLYPLLSFDASDPAGSATWMAGASRGLRTADVDRDTKAVEEVTADEETSPGSTTGARALWGRIADAGTVVARGGLNVLRGLASEDEVGKFVHIPRGEDADEVGRLLHSKFDDVKSLAGMKATAATVGMPFQLPMEIVKLEGLSSRYDGLYTVEVVEHSWQGGLWDTSMEVVSGSYSADADFAAPVEPETTGDPPESVEEASTEKGT